MTHLSLLVDIGVGVWDFGGSALRSMDCLYRPADQSVSVWLLLEQNFLGKMIDDICMIPLLLMAQISCTQHTRWLQCLNGEQEEARKTCVRSKKLRCLLVFPFPWCRKRK